MKINSMLLCVLAILFGSINGFAQEKVKFNFVNEELPKIIEYYSNVSGQKFIIDSTVRGKVSILNQSEISKDDAFNLLSESLALNGFAIIKNEDVMTIRNARSAQRDNIESYTTVPSAKPQRMVTWTISLTNVKATDIQQQIRLLTSAYGELSVFTDNNQLIISDWTGNLQRIHQLIKNIDIPQDKKISKLVTEMKKEFKEKKEAKQNIKLDKKDE